MNPFKMYLLEATANIAEYAAKNGLPFWLAKQVADVNYSHVLREIHRGFAW